MLEVKKITKKYTTGGFTQTALDHVSVNFRENEFAAILGPSGSGKTTLLNIIGGLDRYDSGDLVINGISTKKYKDKDWDAYRNSRIGFIFQSYNLISHQSILSNVEMALTLSGVGRAERKKRAIEALTKVGLGDHINKKPNQLSGGQMQRVAIARALINNPNIILADEPTGALDTKTSIQVMELLKEVAQDRLVIMVTHNPELAKEYATRIVEVKDGHIIGDSNPVESSALNAVGDKPKHTKLKFTTALGLSLNNLMTKKGRTALTAFAGSIGIIGIAAILALSSGVNAYIADQETDMLGSYPITLQKQVMDLTSMMNKSQTSREKSKDKHNHDKNSIYSNNIVGDTVETTENMIKTNDLGKFKVYLDENKKSIEKDVTAIEYSYDITPQAYRDDKKKGVVKVSPATLLSRNGSDASTSSSSSSMFSQFSMNGGVTSSWSKMVSDSKLRDKQYKLLEGSFPTKYNEVALVVSERNEVSDYTLYTLGLMDISSMNDMIEKVQDGKKVKDEQKSFDYKDAIGLKYRVFAPAELYSKSDNVYVDKSKDDKYLKNHLKDGTEVKITGVLRAKEDAEISSGIAYDQSLSTYLLERTASTDVVKAQLKNKKINVLTNKKFGAKSNKSSNAFMKINEGTFKTENDGSTETPATQTEGSNDRFTVTFKNGDTVLATQSDIVKGSSITTFPTATPTRTSENGVNYTFVGWMSSKGGFYTTQQLRSVTVTSDETYTAVFASSSNNPQVSDYLTDEQMNQANSALQNYIKEQQASNNNTSIDPNNIDMNQLRNVMNQSMGTNLTQEQMDSYIASYAQDYIKKNPDLVNNYMKSYMEAYMKKYEKMYLSKIKSSMNAALSQSNLEALMASMSDSTPTSYDEMMEKLNYTTIDQPSSISLYPSSFDSKTEVENFIKKYNKQVSKEEDKVTYTDLIGTVTASITSIIDTISTVLVAFVAISLVVSSIMIAIITYISVLERTKEIGILRALGASKKDISKIFNAETFIEGLLSGIFGIVVTWLITFPVNAMVEKNMDVPNVMVLPINASLILIGISVILTLIAGYIPSRIASKKDPVTSLRSE